jgi:hypothetical protein
MAPPQPPRPGIRTNRVPSNSLPQSPSKELPGLDFSSRPGVNRAVTYDQPGRRDVSPAPSNYSMHRVPSDSLSIRAQKAQLRSVSGTSDQNDRSTYYGDGGESAYGDDAISFGSLPTRTVSAGSINNMSNRKPPPPPPPSRTKKPPPPPPPMRRTTQAV